MAPPTGPSVCGAQAAWPPKRPSLADTQISTGRFPRKQETHLMSYSIESSGRLTAYQAHHLPKCLRRYRKRSSRGQRRRGGASVRPIVQSLLRKRETRRLGMGRRSPHRVSPHSSDEPQAEIGGYVQSIGIRSRGPPPSSCWFARPRNMFCRRTTVKPIRT